MKETMLSIKGATWITIFNLIEVSTDICSNKFSKKESVINSQKYTVLSHLYSLSSHHFSQKKEQCVKEFCQSWAIEWGVKEEEGAILRMSTCENITMAPCAVKLERRHRQSYLKNTLLTQLNCTRKNCGSLASQHGKNHTISQLLYEYRSVISKLGNIDYQLQWRFLK